MKNANRKSPSCAVSVGGIKIEIFWPGNAPMVRPGDRDVRDPAVMRRVHTHFTYEAFFVTAGKLNLMTEDGRHCFARSVVIVPPGVSHYSSPENSGSYCLLFSLDGARAEALRHCLDGEIVALPLEEDTSFYIERLALCVASDSATAQREAELLTGLLFNRLLSHLLPEEGERARGEAKHIAAIEKYINDHLRQGFTLSDVAASVYLSTRQVSRIIRGTYGCGFSELVCTKRLAAAEMLLKNTDMSIAEIAAATFVGARSYFYVLFKKRYGVSPLQYRRRAAQNKSETQAPGN